jgi:hypothetical protein
VSSQGVTFTPTDTGNYTTQTTSVDVGVLCVAPTITGASNPSASGFTVSWSAVSGAGNYTVIHSANKNMSSATSVNTADSSTSLALSVPTGVRYVQVRANNAVGASANSTMQVKQLNLLAANSTTYLSAAGDVSAFTVAGIFGANNTAGLNAGATDSASTNILLLSGSGSTAHTIWYNNSDGVNTWRAAGNGPTNMSSTAIPKGTAFMLRNLSGEADYFLLSASPRSGNFTVSVNATAGQVNLLTPARSTPTALDALGLRTSGSLNSATRIKEAVRAVDADVIMIQDGTGRFKPYHFDGTNWRINRTVVDPATIAVPAGGAFFIRKATGSNFNSWTAPGDE